MPRLSRRGQNTVEYMLMLAAVVGVVLAAGVALKKFMPGFFGQVSGTITSAVCTLTGDRVGNCDGGGGSTASSAPGGGGPGLFDQAKSAAGSFTNSASGALGGGGGAAGAGGAPGGAGAPGGGNFGGGGGINGGGSSGASFGGSGAGGGGNFGGGGGGGVAAGGGVSGGIGATGGGAAAPIGGTSAGLGASGGGSGAHSSQASAPGSSLTGGGGGGSNVASHAGGGAGPGGAGGAGAAGGGAGAAAALVAESDKLASEAAAGNTASRGLLARLWGKLTRRDVVPPSEEEKIRKFQASLSEDQALKAAYAQWETLDPEKKKFALQASADHFSSAYGLDRTALVFQPGAGVSHDEVAGRISVGQELLDKKEQAFELVAHEGAHVYQAALVRSFDAGRVAASDDRYEQARLFKANAQAPLSTRDGYDAYRSQPTEKHAFIIEGVTWFLAGKMIAVVQSGGFTAKNLRRMLEDSQGKGRVLAVGAGGLLFSILIGAGVFLLGGRKSGPNFPGALR